MSDVTRMERANGLLALENAALRTRVEDLTDLLESVRDERDLLTEERDMALHDRDKWHQRYLIATGQGGK